MKKTVVSTPSFSLKTFNQGTIMPKGNPSHTKSMQRTLHFRRIVRLAQVLYAELGEKMFTEGVERFYLFNKKHFTQTAEFGSFVTLSDERHLSYDGKRIIFSEVVRAKVMPFAELSKELYRECRGYTLAIYVYLGGPHRLDPDSDQLAEWEYCNGFPWGKFTANRSVPEMIEFLIENTQFLVAEEDGIRFASDIVEEGDVAILAKLEQEVREQLSKPEEVPDPTPRAPAEDSILDHGHVLKGWGVRMCSMTVVVEVVADYFWFKPEHLLGPTSWKDINHARRILFYLLCMLCKETQQEIGQYVGGRSQAQVCQNFRQVINELDTDQQLRVQIDELRNRLRERKK